jgi:hypothetical protein
MQTARVTKSIFAAALVLVAASTVASAQSPSLFKGVKIDMSAIPAGAAETRAQLQACLTRAVPAALGARLQTGARGAPILVVRPTVVWLANLAPGSLSDDYNSKGGSNSFDTLEGEAIIGQQRIPVMAAANGDFGAGSWSEYGARLRTDQLCQNFALWLVRKI